MNRNNRYIVLFVTHTVRMGGANQSMLRLMLELRDRYQIIPIVLMPKISSKVPKWNISVACDQNNIQWYSCRYYWFMGKNRFKSVAKYLSNIFLYPHVIYKLWKLNVDLVHTNGSVIDIGAWISRFKRKPHVWHLREFGYEDFQLRPVLGHPFQKFLYRNGGDAFVAISKAVASKYSALICDKKLELIYNGIQPPPVRCYSNHCNINVEFCILGRVSIAKNQKEVINALDILVNKRGIKNLHLTMIGEASSEYALEVIHQIEEKHLNDYVTLTGERNNVSELLAQMDVGLMLSTSEAFGRVTIEYMMHNLAVIATDTGANPEIITNRYDGLIYRYGDVQMLANSMQELIETPHDLIKYAKRGQEKALSEFTSEKNSSSIFKLYNNVVEHYK